MAALVTAVAGPATASGSASPAPTQPVLLVADDGSLTRADVTADGLARLRADPLAGSVVTRDGRAHAALAESVPKVGAQALWNDGHRGAGKVVVVIDTGVAPTFGGSLVGQACFAANADGTVGYCGPAADRTQAFDTTCFALGVCDPGDPYYVPDPAAARPCPGAALDCYHGTAVAAVAARHDPPAGVAPDAGVYAIRVFDPSGQGAFFYDILLALDHARQLAVAGMDIAAVNLSVSSGLFPGSCDAGLTAPDEAVAFREVFDDLKAMGIASVVASGNDFRRGSTGFPACVSSAVSVGASDLDDQLADFGNRGPGLDLLAPGAREGNGTVDPLVIPGSPVAGWAGTSFSAPHVAGAFALIEPQYPQASIDQLVGLLRSTGVAVSEPEGAYRRLRLKPPAQALNAQVLFPAGLALAGAPHGAAGDFDGDGHGDVLAHAPGATPDRIVYGGDTWSPGTRSYAVSGSYLPVVGNFRGAAGGPDDILWYAAGSTADFLWSGDPSRTLPSVPVSVNGAYTPVVGDFDGDRRDDVLWYAAGSASDYLWYGGPSGFTSVSVPVTGSYRTAVGDFDGDARDDVVFHGPDAALDFLWRGTATRGVWAKTSLSMGGSYTQRVGDLNGDGFDDLLLYQSGSRTDTIWRGGVGVGSSGGSGGFSPLAISVNGTYQPAVGDVDGDSRDDIVWYAPGSAADYIWFGAAIGLPAGRPVNVNGTYTPLLTDLDDAAGDDIVWFPATGTATPIWWSYQPPG